ncbi:tRNA nucleotidyltransferase/poly(A) polymerase [Rhodospirillaceae bacterium LM-1]|nr:tRNA nucleotidyltransferase/poly(A) polymerase [Rhodospirillaceae bacterium LM-1]
MSGQHTLFTQDGDATQIEGPMGQLAPQPWMEAPTTKTVMAAITSTGVEARFVGGCVRDALLKRPVKDIDIATPLEPNDVIRLLEANGIHAIPTGIAHGTITAVIGKDHFEITTLRHDVENFGRHARVAFTDDWRADALRRDFTINALSMTTDGRIYDPVNGLADLGRGRVRFVGDPKQRIQEDVLRLLRYFRFYAYYGHPPAQVPSLAACRASAHLLPNLSGERIRGEMMRLLMAPDPAGVLTLMQAEKVLPHILPEAKHFGRLRQLAWLEDRGLRLEGIERDPTRRLACLVECDAKGALEIADRFKLSNRDRNRLAAICRHSQQAPSLAMSDGERRHLLYRMGKQTYLDRALIAWSSERDIDPRAPSAASGPWTELLGHALDWTVPEFPLKGRDALALGVPHGPRIGELLGHVQEWWEEGGFRADHAACLDRLRAALESKMS